MRGAVSLSLVAGCIAASPASAVDCAVLRNSTAPFEIKLERRIDSEGAEPAVAEGQLQVFRSGAAQVTYQSFSPGSFFRTRYPAPGFPDEFFVSKEGTRIAVTYSIPPAASTLTDEKPLAFHVTMTRSDGQIVGEQDHALSFQGHRSVDLAGCAFDVVRATRKVSGLINDKYSESETEFWFSPELGTALFLKTVMAKGPTQTYAAKDISLDVKPME